MYNTPHEKIVKLDLKDRKILFELSSNPRAPYSVISKKVGLPRETISYRLKVLKQKKLFLGSFAMINPKIFNYRKYDVLFKLRGVSPDVKDKIIGYLKESPNIMIVTECGGKWDLMITILNKNLDEFYVSLEGIKKKIKSYIGDLSINPVLTEKFTRFGFFKGESHNFSILGDKALLNGNLSLDRKEPSGLNLDELDIAIIRELENDASVSFSKIAHKLKVTHNTITNRFKSLVEANAIHSMFPQISNTLLGLEWHMVFFRLDFPNEKEEREFLTYLFTDPYIVYYRKILGNYNYKITIWSQNTQHLNKIILGLRERFGDVIDEYESLTVFNQYGVSNISDIIKMEGKF